MIIFYWIIYIIYRIMYAGEVWLIYLKAYFSDIKTHLFSNIKYILCEHLELVLI